MDSYEYLSDPETVRFEPYEPFTREQAEREAARRAGDEAFIAVCLGDTGKLIGNLYRAKTDPGCYVLGYVFSRAYWHQGYATEAAKVMLSHMFTEGAAHRVQAECNPANRSSVQLLRRLGFRLEGCLRKNVSFRHDPATGEPLWQDTLLFGLLQAEWAGPSDPSPR